MEFINVYVTVDSNNIVTSYAIPLNDSHLPSNGIIVETSLDLETIYLVGNYKLLDGKLIKVLEEEKPLPPQLEIDKIEVLLLNGYIGNLHIEKKDNIIFISGKLSCDNIISNIIGNIPSNIYPGKDIELNGITITTNGQIINTGLGIINGFYSINI